MTFTTPRLRLVAVTGAAAIVWSLAGTTSGLAATAKSGAACKKAGAKSGSLVCAKKGKKLVWAAGSASTPAPAGGASTTTAGVSGAAAVPEGIEGTWKASAKSVVGYRVKEVLLGQDTEGVGRTNALTGTMTIAGTKVTGVDLVADLRTLASDNNRRDGQVQGRLLETAKFPTATVKLAEPIDLGKVPADGEQVSKKATVDLTIHGVTKRVTFDIVGRRNGANVEVAGSTVIKFSDYGIENPTNQVATVGETGTLEFASVFTR